MESAGRKDETTENKRKRLIFRSGHRGTKEMDIILGTFATKNVPYFSEDELTDYDDLLCHNDPDLYNWITEKESPPDDVARMSVFKKLMSSQN